MRREKILAKGSEIFALQNGIEFNGGKIVWKPVESRLRRVLRFDKIAGGIGSAGNT
jgi:hypothetical protein